MKFREVLILTEAEHDITSARDFYARQEAWLADYCVESLLAELASLHLYAGIHRKVHGFHRLICRRFPYAVYYQISEGSVFVAAILDMRQKPTWINQSLESRRQGKRPGK